jgi:hypothetical protein
MLQRKIFGLSAALVTAFGEDGSVDLARLVSHARHVLSDGCDSVTISSLPVLPAVKALTGHVRKDSGYSRMRPPATDLDPALAMKATAAFDAILAA